MASRVRVRYSGLILFASNILSFLLGTVFIVLISRSLSSFELGLWFFISGVISYFELGRSVIPYWAFRDSSRGMMVGRTAIISGILISILPTIIYLSLAGFFAGLVGAEEYLDIFYIAAIFIPSYHLTSTILSIIHSRFPHKAGLRDLIVDGVKIPLAFLLLGLGLRGVISAVLAAYLAFILAGAWLIRGELRDRVNLGWFKDRIRLFWVPIQQAIALRLTMIVDLFFVGILSSIKGLSVYGVASTIANTVLASQKISRPLYAKMLAQGGARPGELRSVIKLQLLLSIPMILGGTVIADDVAGIFGGFYRSASDVLWILLLAVLFKSLSLTFKNIVRGMEDVDRSVDVSAVKVFRSRLFVAEAVSYISFASLVLFSVALIPLLGLIGAAFSRLLSSLIVFSIYISLIWRNVPWGMLGRDLAKILTASALMVLVLLLINPQRSLVTLAAIGAGAVTYFTALYVIDGEFRGLVRMAWDELGARLSAWAEGL